MIESILQILAFLVAESPELAAFVRSLIEGDAAIVARVRDILPVESESEAAARKIRTP